MDISFQLYSARNFTPWEDVIKTLADLGINNVEGFGGVYEDPATFRGLLDRYGMAMPSGHFFPIGSLEEEIDQSLNTAKTMGMNRIFCPAPEDLWRVGTTAENWVGLARRLEEVGKKVNDAGLRFGWHNHHWEFIALDNGAMPMELILEHAPSIEWEMDVAWVVRGGADPLTWIADHKDRITTGHVKDIAPEGENADEDGWADLGHGIMDWKTLIGALKDVGVDLFVLEHDNPSDGTRYASRSVKTLRTL